MFTQISPREAFCQSIHLFVAANAHNQTYTTLTSDPLTIRFMREKNVFKNLIAEYARTEPKGLADLLRTLKAKCPPCLNLDGTDRIQAKASHRFDKTINPKKQKAQESAAPPANPRNVETITEEIIPAANTLVTTYTELKEALIGLRESPFKYSDYRKAKRDFKKASLQSFKGINPYPLEDLQKALSKIGLGDKTVKKLKTFKDKFDAKVARAT